MRQRNRKTVFKFRTAHANRFAAVGVGKFVNFVFAYVSEQHRCAVARALISAESHYNAVAVFGAVELPTAPRVVIERRAEYGIVVAREIFSNAYKLFNERQQSGFVKFAVGVMLISEKVAVESCLIRASELVLIVHVKPYARATVRYPGGGAGGVALRGFAVAVERALVIASPTGDGAR